MTPAQIRTEALEHFAALTRHKPKDLDGMFHAEQDGSALRLKYGKRQHTLTLPANWETAPDLGDTLKTAALALRNSV